MAHNPNPNPAQTGSISVNVLDGRTGKRQTASMTGTIQKEWKDMSKECTQPS